MNDARMRSAIIILMVETVARARMSQYIHAGGTIPAPAFHPHKRSILSCIHSTPLSPATRFASSVFLSGPGRAIEKEKDPVEGTFSRGLWHTPHWPSKEVHRHTRLRIIRDSISNLSFPPSFSTVYTAYHLLFLHILHCVEKREKQMPTSFVRQLLWTRNDDCHCKSIRECLLIVHTGLREVNNGGGVHLNAALYFRC